MENSTFPASTRSMRHILSDVPVIPFPTRILQGAASTASGAQSTDMEIPDGYAFARFATASPLNGNGVMFGGNELRSALNTAAPGVFDGGYFVRSRDVLSLCFYGYPKTVEAYSHNASGRNFTVELFS